MKYWSPKNFRVHKGVNVKDKNNWFHFLVSAIGGFFEYPLQTYGFGLLWEVWNWGNPSYEDVPTHASWFEENFLYSEGFSLEDATIWDGGGVCFGLIVRGFLVQFGAI